MPISWYPGHMHKAGKELKKIVGATQAFIEVRDARIPLASANPLLDELAGDKPALIILNKEDLADSNTTENWLQYFNRQESRACISTGPDKQRPLRLPHAHRDHDRAHADRLGAVPCDGRERRQRTDHRHLARPDGAHAHCMGDTRRVQARPEDGLRDLVLRGTVAVCSDPPVPQP